MRRSPAQARELTTKQTPLIFGATCTFRAMEVNPALPAAADMSSDPFAAFKPPQQASFDLPSLQQVRNAQATLRDFEVRRTRLVRLNRPAYLMNNVDECGGPRELDIYLKLENEQICNTFKTRGAVNYVASVDPQLLKNGIVTPSVGSFGQALTTIVKARDDIPHCTVLLPDQMDVYRGQLLEAMGARVHKLPFHEWWYALEQRSLPPMFSGTNALHSAHFIHPASSACSVGDSTIALEIVEDLPDVDAIVVPFCTGGFSAGVSHILKQMNCNAKVFAAEVSSSTPLHTAISAGNPSRCNHAPSFVDQIGGENVLPFMWQPIQESGIQDSLVVSQQEVVSAIQLLMNELGVVAEGAGATPLAAALSGKAGAGKICCVVTGGNIDPEFLTQAMHGQIPVPRF